ncbi:dihydrofolate reductase [Actinomortierella wolfii]|nr:dihydrofolate reductase [Actinomortierella wolfii]
MAATSSTINPRAFAIVVAADLAQGIGKNGGLPWRLRKDMAFFAKVTSKIPQNQGKSSNTPPPAAAAAPAAGTVATSYKQANACIMGRKTWESIPSKFRPLANRFNIIVTRNPKYLDDKPEKDHPMVTIASSLEAALDLVAAINDKSNPAPSPSLNDLVIPRTFLIGGSQLYNDGVRSSDLDLVFLTRVHTVVEDCDSFFPKLEPFGFHQMSADKGHTFIESYIEESVEGGIIEEGGYKFEYTVYTK